MVDSIKRCCISGMIVSDLGWLSYLCFVIRIALQVAIFYWLISQCLASSESPEPRPVVDNFRVVEINHLYTKEGFIKFDQLLFKDFNQRTGRYQIEAWIYMKNSRVKTKKGEEQHEKKLDDLLGNRGFSGREDIRHRNSYKGEFIGGPMDPVYSGGKYTVTFHDNFGNVRLAKADRFEETYSQSDPEQDDRKKHPASERRGFTKPRNVPRVDL